MSKPDPNDAAAFAAAEAIRSGAWDRHLATLGAAIHDRAREAFAEQERVKGGTDPT
jgi:hypothetical protein